MNKQQLANAITQYLRENGATMGRTVSGDLKPVPLILGEELLKHILVTFQQVIAVGGKVKIPELGTFQAVERKARIARNPKTGEQVKVPKGRRLKYSMSKEMKSILN